MPLKISALTPSRQPAVRSAPPRAIPPPAATPPPPVEPPVQDVPQGTGEDTLGPASVSPTEPEQGESTETPMVVQPTSTVPRKVRFTLSSSTAEPRPSARINADPSLPPSSTVMTTSTTGRTLKPSTSQPSLHRSSPLPRSPTNPSRSPKQCAAPTLLSGLPLSKRSLAT